LINRIGALTHDSNINLSVIGPVIKVFRQQRKQRRRNDYLKKPKGSDGQ
jgi:outer membrane receptor for ferric coprogen and ferric-rhodotorulic acid